jgi:hypothetical protein
MNWNFGNGNVWRKLLESFHFESCDHQSWRWNRQLIRETMLKLIYHVKTLSFRKLINLYYSCVAETIFLSSVWKIHDGRLLANKNLGRRQGNGKGKEEGKRPMRSCSKDALVCLSKRTNFKILISTISLIYSFNLIHCNLNNPCFQ